MRTKWSPILNVLGANLGTCGTFDVCVIQWEHDRKTLGTKEKYENMSLGQKRKLDPSYLCMLGLLVIP
jgi:hypothetical protein